MIYEQIKLLDIFPQLSPDNDFQPMLISYCHENSPEIDIGRKRGAVVICPGGGYEFTSDREAEPVALQFMASGYNAFVLRYSVSPARYPAALLQLSAAVSYIRSNAEKFHVDVNKIAVCGFSAGGHLAASLGVFWQEQFIAESLKIKEGANRPNALILSYPVITSGKFGHAGSFSSLLGENAAPGFLEKMSLENQVSEKVPPAFIWHTFNDTCVPVENSLLFASALREHGIPFEMHIFPEGVHGLSLCSPETSVAECHINPHCSKWLALCKEWLDTIFKNH